VKYRTIVADPPWEQPNTGAHTHTDAGNWNSGRGTDGKSSIVPYPRMSLDAIRSLRVDSLADDSAHLYLWTTNKFLEQVWSVARAWGFKPSTMLTWCKPRMGIGFGGAFTIASEYVLFARRGSLPAIRRQDGTWFQWPRPYSESGGPIHSAKPEHFYDLVEQVSPGPYVELFARRHRLGWDTWGLECANTTQWDPAV
jgi:N6-adenosine-specific RNA methylase IME4